MMRRVDVLIVGLGPGGGAAAGVAARGGLSVLGIDKRKQIGEPVQCAEFIPSPMTRYAQDDGVLVQAIKGMKSALPSGHVEQSAFTGLMIDRAQFDRALAARAKEAGAELRTETRLVGLDAARSVARLQGTGRELHDVHYTSLIAADGPHSTVAALLGLPALSAVHTRQYTVPLLGPYQDTDIWLSDDFPGGYAWLFPKGAVANLGVGADRRHEPNLKRPLDQLHHQLAAQGLVGTETLGRTGGAIPVGGMRDRLTIGNIAFVGDAAGLTHPITGAGIAAAVVSGERAGEAVARCIRHGDRQAFAAFEEEVRDQFEVTLTRAEARRRFLNQYWRRPEAHEDRIMRRGWIAFDEYFSNDVAVA